MIKSPINLQTQAELTSFHAPAERLSLEEIRQEVSYFEKLSMKQFVDAVPDFYLILNKNRQIVYANQAFQKFFAPRKVESIYGLRPGEALRCIHACETAGGCGTSEFCQTCGAVNAILNGLSGVKDVQECCILRGEGHEALDLRVWSTPYPVEDREYCIFVVTDISHEKRRRALERIFYHDILNTAWAALGFAQLIKTASAEKIHGFRERIQQLTHRIIDEIQTQRELSEAENGELALKITPLRTVPFLQDIVEMYQDHETAQNRKVVMDPQSANVEFTSDAVLLSRVVGNLVKNALEAVPEGRNVTLGCRVENDRIVFWVHNPGMIPRRIQLQIFQRSFTTKSQGRGLGTYSIKLLTERYLSGRVTFSSSEKEGTEFRVTYPQFLQR